MKQPKDVQVVSKLDVMQNELSRTIETNLVDYPFLGVLRNLRSEETEEYDEVNISGKRWDF